MKMNLQLILITGALVSSQIVFADQQDAANSSKNSQTTQSSQSSQQDRSSASSDASASNGQSGTKVMFNQLPQPVQKTFRAESGMLNIENLRKLTKNGETRYQGTFDKGDMKGKITVAKDGSLLRFQESSELALVPETPRISQTGTKLSDLPEAVQKTIKEQAGSATPGDFSKSTESGKTVYHAAFNESGVHTDLFLAEDGKIVGRADETALYAEPMQNSQTVSLSTAPEAVQKAVRDHTGSSAEVTDIDKGTWNGQTVYKVMLDKNGSARPLVISENGQLVSSKGPSSVGAPAASESSQGQNQQSSQSPTKSDQQKQ
jgi:hypothetical protein